MSKLAVTFTVNNRPNYFEQVLGSWSAVRDKEDVNFYFNCEPPNDSPSVKLAEQWLKEHQLIGRVYHNATQFGVGHNPYMALTRAFGNPTVDYTILAEDDLLVSNDILEYHKWAAETFSDEPSLAMVCSFSDLGADSTMDYIVARRPNFASVLVWGTWRDRWVDIFEPTWDHDYSTGGEYPAGWDWNINKRILPKLGNKYSLQPISSRVQNIGAVGTHSPAGAHYIQAPSFELERKPTTYGIVW